MSAPSGHEPVARRSNERDNYAAVRRARLRNQSSRRARRRSLCAGHVGGRNWPANLCSGPLNIGSARVEAKGAALVEAIFSASLPRQTRANLRLAPAPPSPRRHDTINHNQFVLSDDAMSASSPLTLEGKPCIKWQRMERNLRNRCRQGHPLEVSLCLANLSARHSHAHLC